MRQGRVCTHTPTHAGTQALNYNIKHTYQTPSLAKRPQKYRCKDVQVCYAVSHAANFARPNLDLPRGFFAIGATHIPAAGFMQPHLMLAMMTTYSTEKHEPYQINRGVSEEDNSRVNEWED